MITTSPDTTPETLRAGSALRVTLTFPEGHTSLEGRGPGSGVPGSGTRGRHPV